MDLDTTAGETPDRPRGGLLGQLLLTPFLVASFLLEGGDGGSGGSGGDGGSGDGSGDPGAGGSGDGGNGDPGKPWDGPFDETRARATIESQRKAEQNARDAEKAAKAEKAAIQKELDDVKTKLTEFTDAGKSDVEKLTNRVQALEADKGKAEATIADKDREIQELRTHREFLPVATKAKAIDNEAVWAVLDLKAVDYDDSGAPKNLEKLVEGLKEKHPRLFETGKPTGDGDGGARGSGSDEDVPMGSARLRRAYSKSGS